MCGICGRVNWTPQARGDPAVIRRMTFALRHRGPDAFGLYEDQCAQLGHARLSIIDLAGGSQPMANEDQSLLLVFNGEIYNYRELRPSLEKRGHLFRTNSDTEVILHAYESFGAKALDFLNGQFAFALWDGRKRELFLARDRFGIRPLYYARRRGGLIFASELKSLFQDPDLTPRIDPRALDELFTFWSVQPPRTPFAGIEQLPPGHLLQCSERRWQTRAFWDMSYPPGEAYCAAPREEGFAEELLHTLTQAVQLRMRADVPVAGYLSGGLDSSLTTALIRRASEASLDTFSVRFSDPAYDEGAFQDEMLTRLGTRHRTVTVHDDTVAATFPNTIWHTESPILRTAPVPLMALSALVRRHGTKVVVTGEGADELFAGYNIFKEDKVRRFWARHPASTLRPLLLARLYPYLRRTGNRSDAMAWTRFFGRQLTETDHPAYSHLIRWGNTAALKRFFSPELREQLGDYDPLGVFVERIPAEAEAWDPLSRAQYIEIKTFMGSYLLCSQGDRVGMANSVEGRFPFLDHNVAAFAATIPPQLRLRVLEEKYLLREVARDLLPESIRARVKQPYRAPDSASFRCPAGRKLIATHLSEQAVGDAGYFSPRMAATLARKVLTAPPDAIAPREDMALLGLLSTQILHDQFVDHFPRVSVPADVRFHRANSNREAGLNTVPEELAV